ncbi:MAG TPA: D-2-hydroxyacid dehydrogenase [Candidatus Gemmiger avium]|nr:D-2-hydroxyacid dehydrogenase [Candidatus Gemmiger avium]
MKIVILDGYTENPGDLSWGGFEALGSVTVYDRTPADQILARAKGAEIVLTNKTPLSAQTLAALAPELQYIGVLATGYNVVDIAAARAQGIPVCNIPTYGTTAVAQFVMALLLELCHHVGDHSRSVKAGDWSRCPDFCYWNSPLIELAGKTFGVIGYGRIGRATARLAAAFGMEILAYDAHATGMDEVARLVSLDELLERSDVISLHCPLFESNRGMINRASIARMKDGVLLINTSRGPLIDEAALAEALHAGKVAGAGLDVLETEPARPDNPLLAEPNCLITPHIAWAPKESRQRLMDIAVENLQAWLKGNPQNVVNP